MGAENIKLGTCSITYDGQDLGLTIGGVEVEVQTNTHQTTVDQFGETIVKEYVTGRTLMVKCPLAETHIDQLVNIMPGATKVIDGVDPTKIKIEVDTAIGLDMLGSAKKLVLHPVANDVSDVSEDFVVPLAAAPGALQFAYKTNEERIFLAEFKGYPDDNGLLFVVGDETATA